MNREMIEAYMTCDSLQALKIIESVIVTDSSPIFNDGIAYKRFADLKFKPHTTFSQITRSAISELSPVLLDMLRAEQAFIEYDNGYGNSVLLGSLFYSNGIDTYELAIITSNGIAYDTPITRDVIGRVKAKEVDLLMIATQRLPHAQHNS